jgi:hypothetical protein
MWPLSAEYLDEEVLSGLLPTLYSEEPAASEAALLADPVRAQKDVEALNRVFFIPEVVQLEEALKIVRKPRPSDAYFAFKASNLDRIFELSAFQIREQGT